MKITLKKPIHELYLESLTSTVLDEAARRVLGVYVVAAMEANSYPQDVIDATKQVYREYYPGMFQKEPTMKRFVRHSKYDRDGIPHFPSCHATKRNAAIRREREPFTQGDLWTIGCYLEAAYRSECETFGVREDMNRLLRKVTYYYRHGMPNTGAVPRRGSDVGTSPLLAVSESGDK
jgi:hypothetical protein